MSIEEELREELNDAIRTRDRARAEVIRQIVTEVTYAKAAPGFDGEGGDNLYLAVIGSYVKKMAKASKEFEAAGEKGESHVTKLAYEIDYLSRWLPEKLSEEETRSLVRVTIVELDASEPRQAGRVIGAVMKSGFEVDGGLVSRLVAEELAE